MLGPLEGLADVTGRRRCDKAIPLCPVLNKQRLEMRPPFASLQGARAYFRSGSCLGFLWSFAL